MTKLMFKLRRSPRTLLERDGHPGPGPGNLALVMARAGVGKTAFLVGIGIDAALSGQNVLHISLERSVDKVRGWYDDLLHELLAREGQAERRVRIQLETERKRHIHTFVNDSFTPARVRQSVELLVKNLDFKPHVIIVDRLPLEETEVATVEELKKIASEVDAEFWLSCRTHREGPQGEPGQLPPPAEPFQELVDLAFRLDPHEDRVRLHVLKDRQEMIGKDLNILLDPQSMLLTTGFSRHY